MSMILGIIVGLALGWFGHVGWLWNQARTAKPQGGGGPGEERKKTQGGGGPGEE
jgi:hypothetical protein